MSTSIVMPMVTAVLLAFLMLGFGAFQEVQLRTALSTNQVAVRSSERVQTRITAKSAVVSGEGTTLTLQFANDGGLSLTDFDQMDLIVDYAVTPNQRVVAYLTYTEGGPLAGQWRVVGLSPDTLHPGLWNPGETLTIEAKLPASIPASRNGVAILAAPNGVTGTTYFSR